MLSARFGRLHDGVGLEQAVSITDNVSNTRVECIRVLLSESGIRLTVLYSLGKVTLRFYRPVRLVPYSFPLHHQKDKQDDPRNDKVHLERG